MVINIHDSENTKNISPPPEAAGIYRLYFIYFYFFYGHLKKPVVVPERGCQIYSFFRNVYAVEVPLKFYYYTLRN